MVVNVFVSQRLLRQEKNECQDYNNEMKERILQYCHNLNPRKIFNDE